MSNLIQTAKARNEANKAYKTAVSAEMRSLKPMDPEEFWETLACLASNLKAGKTSVDSAMHNFMCNAVYQSYGTCPPCFDELSKHFAWELACRFLRKYEEVKATLSKKMHDMKGLDRGDDGYGDLMDSLPLAGRDIVDAIMSDDIANYKQLEKALGEVHEKHSLKKFILDGENYITMKLEEALVKAYLSVVRDIDDEGYSEERRSDPHVVLVTTTSKQGYTLFGMQVNVRGPFQDRYEAEAFAKQEDGACTVVKLFGGVVKK